MHRQLDGPTHRGDNIITSAVGVVVPLEGDLIASGNVDRLGGLDTSSIALDVFRCDIKDGVVVGG